MRGIAGVITGRALYEGRFTLSQAIAATKQSRRIISRLSRNLLGTRVLLPRNRFRISRLRRFQSIAPSTK